MHFPIEFSTYHFTLVNCFTYLVQILFNELIALFHHHKEVIVLNFEFKAIYPRVKRTGDSPSLIEEELREFEAFDVIVYLP